MKTIANLGIVMMLAALATACDRDTKSPEEIPPGEQTGQLRLMLNTTADQERMDSRVEEVWIRVDSVQVRHDEQGWIELTSERQDLNLLSDDLTGQQDFLLAEADVFVGAYDRARIGLEDAWIVVNGQEFDLNVSGDFDPLDPFAMNLTLDEPFFVTENMPTTVRITWDLTDDIDEDDLTGWTLTSDTQVEVEIGDQAGGGGQNQM